jgi:ABC-type uncharacterized transport system auxiliary subunit
MRNNLSIMAAAALALSGCVSILPEPDPAPAVYRLSTNLTSVDKIGSPELIRVDRPGASQIFNSNDIVVSMDGQKLSAVAQANWSEVTPVTIQDAMIDALGSSRQFIALLPTSGARSETRLHLSVKNFEASFDQGELSAPLAVVQYRVTYARADDRSLIGTHTVRKTQRADSINVSSIVRAIEGANDAAMADIVSWLEGVSRSS